MSLTETRRWVMPGNDYRRLASVDPEARPSLVVLISGEGSDTKTTLDALGEQDYAGDLRVVAVTDEQLPEMVGPWPVQTFDRPTPLDQAVGYEDVIALLSPGQVPGNSWARRHSVWHSRARNLVVLGQNMGEDPSQRFIRRSRNLLSSDEAFTAMRPTNISMRWDAWHGSVPDVIRGWRLWNDGFFFVYEPEATVSNDGQAIFPQPVDRISLEDAIPHRAYRPFPSAFHGTPKVSWLAGVATGDEALSAWWTCQQSSFADHELILHGPRKAIAAFESVAAGNERVSIVPGDEATFQHAVQACRGELVAILDPRATVQPETLAKAIARFEAKPTSPVVCVGYQLAGDRYLRLDDLAAVDRELGRDQLPLFAVVARRELMKDPDLLATPNTAWSSILDRTSPSLVISPLVEMDETAAVEARTAGIGELSAIGLGEIARVVVREARRRRAGSSRTESEEGAAEADTKVSVAYVGFTGHDNLGDEAVRIAIERLMPWANFTAEPTDPRLLMVGGGTLINGRRYYLTRLLRQESATVERALFGTGVRSPDYWGVTEPMEDWFSFIDSSLVAAVRGPDSVKYLRKLGYHSDLPIMGDPALYLQPPTGSERVDGRLVVCPVYTSGNLHGGNDDVVFDALARLIARLRAEGREVVMLSAFPQDDRWVIDIMRRADAPDLPYVAGYADIDATMELLASADVVVGERLHAAIMAAAAGTPFVGLEYRPKMRDFARSVGQEDAVIRTDEMDRLDEVFSRVMSRREEIVGDLEDRVNDFRGRQEAAASQLRQRLLGS